jgi:hypothetical protein
MSKEERECESRRERDLVVSESNARLVESGLVERQGRTPELEGVADGLAKPTAIQLRVKRRQSRVQPAAEDEGPGRRASERAEEKGKGVRGGAGLAQRQIDGEISDLSSRRKKRTPNPLVGGSRPKARPWHGRSWRRPPWVESELRRYRGKHRGSR